MRGLKRILMRNQVKKYEEDYDRNDTFLSKVSVTNEKISYLYIYPDMFSVCC